MTLQPLAEVSSLCCSEKQPQQDLLHPSFLPLNPATATCISPSFLRIVKYNPLFTIGSVSPQTSNTVLLTLVDTKGGPHGSCSVCVLHTQIISNAILSSWPHHGHDDIFCHEECFS